MYTMYLANRMRWMNMSRNLMSGPFVAQLVEHMTHVQRLCTRCSDPGFESDL